MQDFLLLLLQCLIYLNSSSTNALKYDKYFDIQRINRSVWTITSVNIQFYSKYATFVCHFDLVVWVNSGVILCISQSNEIFENYRQMDWKLNEFSKPNHLTSKVQDLFWTTSHNTELTQGLLLLS